MSKFKHLILQLLLMPIMPCFCKGGSNEIPETAAEKASADIAMKNYNDYMTTIKPFQDKYIADVTGDYTAKTAQAQGMASADIMQKTAAPAFDPNHGIASGAGMGSVMADAGNKTRLAVGNQKAANYQSVIDMGMGKATTAQQGMSQLAQQSAVSATNTAQNQQDAENSRMAAGASGLGVVGGMAKNYYDDKYKK